MTLTDSQLSFVAELNTVSRAIAIWAQQEIERGNSVSEVRAKLRKLADIAARD